MKSFVVGALAFSLVACGGESESAKKAAAPASTGTAASSVDAGAAAGAPTAVPSPVAASEKALEAASKAFADARAANDARKLFEMTKAMLPTDDELRTILRAGPDTDAFLAQYKAERIRGDANEAAREILKPKQPTQTVVKVHSATTEELAAYAKGSVASTEFHELMQVFATKVAAPGRVWHTLEYLAPGESLGMKFSVFTVLDGRVLFLVKPWKAFRDSK